MLKVVIFFAVLFLNFEAHILELEYILVLVYCNLSSKSVHQPQHLITKVQQSKKIPRGNQEENFGVVPHESYALPPMSVKRTDKFILKKYEYMGEIQ